jgi:hypothetical protein
MKDPRKLAAAKECLALARELTAADDDGDGEKDEQFASRVRNIKTKMNKLSQKKTRKLKQFGIPMIRPSSSVEDLVGALEKVLAE